MTDTHGHIISIDNVAYRYPSADRAALRGISLKVEEGEFLLIIGASGSGKSTLLRLLDGLVPHFYGGELSGSIRVAGRDPVEVGPGEMSDTVGLVFQDPEAQFVAEMVEDELAFALENAGLPLPTMRKRVEEALDALSINHLRGRRINTLSGGEKQRVAIASVLTLHPQVLVLDEPTSQLDPQSAEEVLDSLIKLNKDLGLTVILSEHRLERVVQHADRILYMAQDGSTLVGEPRQILAQAPLAPPLVQVGKLLGWEPLPLTIKEGRRFAKQHLGRMPSNAGVGGWGLGVGGGAPLSRGLGDTPNTPLSSPGSGVDRGAPLSGGLGVPPNAGVGGWGLGVGGGAPLSRGLGDTPNTPLSSPGSGVDRGAPLSRGLGVPPNAGVGGWGLGVGGGAPLSRGLGVPPNTGVGGWGLGVDRGAPLSGGLGVSPNSPPSSPFPRGEGGQGDRGYAVSLRNVWFGYGGREIFHGLDLDVRAGEITAVMGRNGTGKTTLLKLMMGLLRPSRGKVDTLGADTRSASLEEMSRLAGYVPQQPDVLLFADTVQAEIDFTRKAQKLAPDGAELLARLGLADHREHDPRDLSVGERQRVALAAVLAADPQALLLDEPTRGLDYLQKEALAHVLRGLRDAGRTIILSTHDVELAARLADRVVLMGDGDIVADGPAREVMSGSLVFSSQVSKLFGDPALVTVEDVKNLFSPHNQTRSV